MEFSHSESCPLAIFQDYHRSFGIAIKIMDENEGKGWCTLKSLWERNGILTDVLVFKSFVFVLLRNESVRRFLKGRTWCPNDVSLMFSINKQVNQYIAGKKIHCQIHTILETWQKGSSYANCLVEFSSCAYYFKPCQRSSLLL